MINKYTFYREYHGHPVRDLQEIVNTFRRQNAIVFLAGDSSLDNKYWLSDQGHAVNGYEKILDPPYMRKDVCYHLNNILSSSLPNIKVVNCAVEESTLNGRQQGLLPQDLIIKNNLRECDTVIISIGGNDIALKPNMSTIFNLLMLCYANSIDDIRRGPDHCWGMQYFINMFKNGIENYIRRLTERWRPKKIIVCMIYYPDELNTNSWASRTLNYLGYNRDPTKLQEIIRQIYKHAIMKITVPGIDIVPFPMYEILDGKDTKDYVDRVEPSSQGSEKLAKGFSKFI